MLTDSSQTQLQWSITPSDSRNQLRSAGQICQRQSSLVSIKSLHQRCQYTTLPSYHLDATLCLTTPVLPIHTLASTKIFSPGPLINLLVNTRFYPDGNLYRANQFTLLILPESCTS